MKSETSSGSLLVSHPLIVIGIPCFNEADWLGRTIESVKAQTHCKFTVLIADNASTDSTGIIARTIAEADSRFRYHRHTENLGAASNFNFVLDRTESPFFLWLGAHDLLDPRFLEKHLEALGRDPLATVSQSTHAWIDEHDRPVERVRDGPLEGGKPDSVRRYLASVRANRHNIGINSVLRRSALTGACFTTIIGTDRIILSRLAYRGPFNDIDEVLYQRRTFRSERGGWGGYMERLTGRFNSGPAANWKGMADAYDEDLSELTRGQAMQPLYRALLQIILRYYLPVDRNSLLTSFLWTVRRSTKLIVSIGRRSPR